MKFLKMANPNLGPKELKYVTDCIKTGWVSSIGKYVSKFERKFAEFCKSKYAISTSNGTAALHLGLETLGIGPGDEVIVPALTFIATANAVIYSGARPVFIDAERKSWNIDHEKIVKAITRKTKAIIPVHLYGNPADMSAIMKIAKKYNLYVIEDAAEASGAEYKGKKVGSIGDIGCFSFFGNKIITTGEGGMLVTNNKKVYEKALILKNHGMLSTKKYWHPYVGYNYRLTNLQAAVGAAQMEKIYQLVGKKRKIARLYNKYLKDIEGITLPAETSGAKHVYGRYTILIEKKYGLSRDELAQSLKKAGIDSSPMYYPIHIMPPYKTSKRFAVAEELSRKGLSLPSGFDLTENDIIRIARCIRNNKRTLK